MLVLAKAPIVITLWHSLIIIINKEEEWSGIRREKWPFPQYTTTRASQADELAAKSADRWHGYGWCLG